MGYHSKIQVIQRGPKNKQYYLICPAPMAQALEMAKGEDVEWIIEDRNTIILRRQAADPAPSQEEEQD